MRVLICGSRHFNDYKKLREELDEWRFKNTGREFTEIIHGAAKGADTLAGEYAEEYGISVRAFPALWDKQGKSAGPIRNALMLSEGKPDIVFAFRGLNSRGTQNMINQSLKAEIEVRIIPI